MWRNLFAVVAAAGVMTAGGAISGRVRPVVAQTGGLPPAQQGKLEEAASASLLGQFRSSMADFLWLKADKYLHNGVDLRGLTAREGKSHDVARANSAAGEHDCGHHDETTVIPEGERDWRGVFGDLEREIKPYQDMRNHRHRDPEEALPLFRLMTWSNPRFVPGYVIGASLIARERSKVPEAVSFLKEGAKNNPHSIEIQNALGMMLTARQRWWDEAVPYLKRAIQIGAARDPRTLTEDESEAYRDAFRWLVLNRREAGRPAEARAAALAGLHAFPGDVVCRNHLRGKRQAPPLTSHAH